MENQKKLALEYFLDIRKSLDNVSRKFDNIGLDICYAYKDRPWTATYDFTHVIDLLGDYTSKILGVSVWEDAINDIIYDYLRDKIEKEDVMKALKVYWE